MLKISSKLLPNFKGHCSSPEIIMLFVYMKARFALSYRDLEEMMHIRGAVIDHSTVARWVGKFVTLMECRVRQRRKPVNGSWRMDETYIKVNGAWVYLYRAVDSLGNIIEFLLKEKRDLAAAKAFFQKAFRSSCRPDKVNIDKSGSNIAALKALNKSQPKTVEIRQNKYRNNIIEQEHRFIKKKTKPMLGFKNLISAENTLAGMECIRMIQKGQIFGQTKNFCSFNNFASLMA